MRPLEIVLIVVAVVAVGWPSGRSRVVGLGVALAAAAAALLQVVLEGARWQLLPAYGVVVPVVVWRLVHLRSPRTGHRAWRVAGLVTGVVALVLSAAAGTVLPAPSLPAPEGPHAVGTTSWELAPTGRDDPYREGERRLVAQAWYPTTGDGPVAPWVADADAFSAAVGPQVGVPGIVLGHLGLVESNAVADAPIAGGTWPVVVYSHGWSGFRTVQSDLAESLASHGFVVLALDHTSGAAISLFPDGSAIPLDPSANPDPDEVGSAVYRERITLLEATFSADVATLLDQLAEGAGPAVLGDDLQLDGVGLVGHSTGGGAAYRFCIVDDRCAAALGFDPWVEPIPAELRAQGLDVPVRSIRSEAWQGNDNDTLLRGLHADSPGDAGVDVVPGAIHRDFTLLPFLSPLAGQLGLSGDVDAAAMHDAIDRVAVAFFAWHLRGEDPGTDRPALVVPDPVAGG
ncbi:dienelactone hydrolase family protein [Euzebya sp.]|uniref:alpha/beta hydrolase n=1 Tax=Euzebya sp. TaxID=1971409 RepID=UPI0035177CA4